MSDLAAFLRARLDEDEAPAKACHYANWQAGSDADVVPVRPEGNSYVAVGPWGSGMEDADVRHIARHDPARVLRDVEAKRAILGAYESQRAARFNDPAVVDELRDVVQTLASVYSDHPDYSPEWAGG